MCHQHNTNGFTLKSSIKKENKMGLIRELCEKLKFLQIR